MVPTLAKATKRMGEVHRLLTEHGKQELLNGDVDRRVLDAAAAYMAAEDGEIGFVYAGWAQASLPHRRLADDAHWEIQNDRVSLIVQPGLRAVPGQSPVSVGVPTAPAPASSSSTFRQKLYGPKVAKLNWAVASMHGSSASRSRSAGKA